MKRLFVTTLFTLVMGILPRLAAAQDTCSPNYMGVNYANLPCYGVCVLVNAAPPYIECTGGPNSDHIVGISNDITDDVFIWGWIDGGEDALGNPIITHF